MGKRVKIISKLAIVLLVVLCLTATAYITVTMRYSDELSLAKKYAGEFFLDYTLVLAVMARESSFDEKAVSRAGAMGIMQLMPDTARWIAEQLDDDDYTEERLFDPHVNTRYGCYYLSYLYGIFDDTGWALCAYNAGPTRAMGWRDEGLEVDNVPYEETRNYAKNVLKYAKLFDFLW